MLRIIIGEQLGASYRIEILVEFQDDLSVRFLLFKVARPRSLCSPRRKYVILVCGCFGNGFDRVPMFYDFPALQSKYVGERHPTIARLLSRMEMNTAPLDIVNSTDETL